jgi:hypothetical protein
MPPLLPPALVQLLSAALPSDTGTVKGGLASCGEQQAAADAALAAGKAAAVPRVRAAAAARCAG